MSFACIYGTECSGPACEDCARYVEPRTQEDIDEESDLAYDRNKEENQ